MMQDRELLELAAKAAGFVVYAPSMLGGLVIYGQAERWNPLTDDGDALRLAVKLTLDIRWSVYGGGFVVAGSPINGPEEAVGTDPYAATRRAIVRAAAEIGKGMQ